MNIRLRMKNLDRVYNVMILCILPLAFVTVVCYSVTLF